MVTTTTSFSKGVSRLFRKCILIVLSFFWLVLIPMLLVIFSPFYIWRKLVKIYAKKFRKDLGNMVTAQSSIMAIDDMQGKPECNVVIWFSLKGDVTVQEFQTGFKDRVLSLRNCCDGTLMYPELRQYYERVCGFLFWKWDENFDLNNHIKVCDEIKNFHDSHVTEEQMIKVNETLLSKPWPENQSPWSFLIVPNYKSKKCGSEVLTATNDCDGKTKNNDNEMSVNSGKLPLLPLSSNSRYKKMDRETLIIFHLHHGMGDGYSFLKLLVGHLAGEKNGRVAKSKTLERNLGKLLWSSISFPLRVLYEFSVQAYDGYDVNSWHLPEQQLTRNLRLGKTERIPISFIKKIKKAYSVSFSAVLFAATAGGLRSYFLEQGLKVPDGMHVFIPWPFPNHPDNKLRNHLTGCFGELPLGKPTARERLDACHKFMESMRGSTIPLANFYLCLIGGSLPIFLKDLSKNYHASGIWSNFPGTEDPFYILGREVTEFSYNVASLHGRTGFTFTALSYRQHVTIDLTIDKALAPSEDAAKNLIIKIHEEFNVLWDEVMA